MSKALKALLSNKEKPTKKVFIRRLNENFEVTALTDEEVEELKEQATYTTGKGKAEVNSDELNRLMVVKATLDPDFNSKEVLDMYNVPDGASAVKKAIYAGEYQKVLAEILSLSGFGDVEEEIKEIKN